MSARAPLRASHLRRFLGASLSVAPARASRLRRFLGASLLATLFAAGCSDPTEIVLGIATNLKLKQLKIEVGPENATPLEYPFDFENVLHQDQDMPATFGLVPKDDPKAKIVIRVSATGTGSR